MAKKIRNDIDDLYRKYDQAYCAHEIASMKNIDDAAEVGKVISYLFIKGYLNKDKQDTCSVRDVAHWKYSATEQYKKFLSSSPGRAVSPRSCKKLQEKTPDSETIEDILCRIEYDVDSIREKLKKLKNLME